MIRFFAFFAFFALWPRGHFRFFAVFPQCKSGGNPTNLEKNIKKAIKTPSAWGFYLIGLCIGEKQGGNALCLIWNLWERKFVKKIRGPFPLGNKCWMDNLYWTHPPLSAHRTAINSRKKGLGVQVSVELPSPREELRFKKKDAEKNEWANRSDEWMTSRSSESVAFYPSLAPVITPIFTSIIPPCATCRPTRNNGSKFAVLGSAGFLGGGGFLMLFGSLMSLISNSSGREWVGISMGASACSVGVTYAAVANAFVVASAVLVMTVWLAIGDNWQW